MDEPVHNSAGVNKPTKTKEQKKARAEAQKRWRRNKRARAEAAAQAKEEALIEFKEQQKKKADVVRAFDKDDPAESFDYFDSCKKEEAKDLIRDRRNLTQSYMVDGCYQAGLIAARRLKLISNRYFWTHGVLSVLESFRTNSAQCLLPSSEDKKAINNLFREQDQVAWWDFATSWREQPAKKDWWEEGHKITLDEFRKLDALKTSPCDMGNVLLGRTYEDMHREWQNFFPQIDANLLPENYDQRTFKDVIASLSDCHDYMKSAARGFFKSTWMRDYVAAWLICYPDSRVCVASASSQLAVETVKNIKEYWLVNGDLSLFQQIFGYMCEGYTSKDVGTAATYDSPAARLHLTGSSTFALALGQNVAGFRATLLIGDDCSSQLNSDSAPQRAKTQRAWDLLCQIREGGEASYVFQIGTPYSEGDLLFTTIERNDRDSEKAVKISFDPALEVIDEKRRRECIEKPESYLTLLEHEVKMRFEREYSFKAAKKELHTSDLKTWLQQKMLQFTKDGELIRLNFEKEELEKAVVEERPRPDEITQVIVTLDRAHSIKKTADRSAIGVCMFHNNNAGQSSMCVLHSRGDRWPTSVVAQQLCDVVTEWKPNLVVVEKDNAWADFRDVLQIECDRRGLNFDIYWRTPDTARKSKVLRFKQLEGLLANSRLSFLRGPHLERLFGEFIWQDGIKVSDNSNHKDDHIDSCSIAALYLPGLVKGEDAVQAQKERESKDEHDRMMRDYYRIFGNCADFATPGNPGDYIEQSTQESPVHAALKKAGLVREGADEGGGWIASGAGFGFLKK